jgi:hypothetical protein
VSILLVGATGRLWGLGKGNNFLCVGREGVCIRLFISLVNALLHAVEILVVCFESLDYLCCFFREEARQKKGGNSLCAAAGRTLYIYVL